MADVIDLMVETMDGTVTNIYGTNEANVFFVERNILDETSTDYRSNIGGAPGMVTAVYEIEASPELDIHNAWLCAMDESSCCVEGSDFECDVTTNGDDDL